MKDLSTKTLFIVLFLSAAVPFAMQANFQSSVKVAFNEKGQTCQRTLVEAAGGFKENLEEVKLLLENGADVDAVNSFGGTALMEASWRGHLKTVEVLIANNASVNIVDQIGKTALMEAVRWGRLEAAKSINFK